jgi:hypothetical protein
MRFQRFPPSGIRIGAHMIRLGSVLGVAFGLALIVVAYVAMQDVSVAEPQTAALDAGCVAEKVALDEGYGVSRTEIRVVCKDAKDKEKPEDKKN